MNHFIKISILLLFILANFSCEKNNIRKTSDLLINKYGWNTIEYTNVYEDGTRKNVLRPTSFLLNTYGSGFFLRKMVP